MTITISPDGVVHCVYTEALPLHELGPLDVRRFGHVEWEPAMQKWAVRLVSDPDRIAFAHRSRKVATEWEHQKADESS